VYPNAHLPFVATPFTVSKSTPASYHWNALLTGGHYDFSAYGPNRFLRRFAGRLHPDAGGPAVSAEVVGGRQRALRLTLENLGSGDIHFSLNAHDFVTDRKEVVVKGRRSRVIEWALSDGYYDVIVTTDTDAVFRYRFAGHIEKRSSAGHTD
jgi:phospholipase C